MEINVLVWIMLSYGLMNIIVFGSIFEPMRLFVDRISKKKNVIGIFFQFIDGVINCPMCFSVWGGFFLSVFIWSPTLHLFDVPYQVSWFFDGILSSGAVWAINSLVEFFEENRFNTK